MRKKFPPQKEHQDSERSSRGPRRHKSPRKFTKPTDTKKPHGEEFRLTPNQLKEALALTSAKLESWQKEISHQAPPPSSANQFALDDWQREAFQALNEGQNIVVDAPTTAGKTRVVESFFQEHYRDPGFRACYTCPVKSLSNDKVREFRERFGPEFVGIATGDIKENLAAPIVVATLETYRNSLLGMDPDLNRNIVIFDEYHFLQDYSRGSSWEEAMILTPPDCQIVLLSASIANGSEFADWLEKLTGRKAMYMYVKERPVPLVNLVWTSGHWLLAESLPPKIQDFRKRVEISHEDLAQRLPPLIEMGLTPSIVYAGKRASCMHLAIAIKKAIPPMSEAQRNIIGNRLLELDREYQVLTYIKPDLRQLMQVYGVAYHHSGHTPQVRLAIEVLVKEGLLRFCTATMGLSLGINFSVRSTLISDLERPGEFGLAAYIPSEVLQMVGRAGRRGKDTVGFNLWPTIPSYTRLGKPKREVCVSNLRVDPTTFLGLISRGYSLGQLERFYKKSFLKFKHPEVQMELVADQKRQKRDQKRGGPRLPLVELHQHLRALGALDQDNLLTPYGEIARFLPQAGGLMLAKMIHEESIGEHNLIETIQLMAALSTAHHKSPLAAATYQFPFEKNKILKALKGFYPFELFPELYEESKWQPDTLIYKEFNPMAGYVLREWAEGMGWETLVKQVVHEKYAQGDVTNLIYRVVSCLQSIAQIKAFPVLRRACLDLKSDLMRDPVRFLF